MSTLFKKLYEEIPRLLQAELAGATTLSEERGARARQRTRGNRALREASDKDLRLLALEVNEYRKRMGLEPDPSGELIAGAFRYRDAVREKLRLTNLRSGRGKAAALRNLPLPRP